MSMGDQEDLEHLRQKLQEVLTENTDLRSRLAYYEGPGFRVRPKPTQYPDELKTDPGASAGHGLDNDPEASV